MKNLIFKEFKLSVHPLTYLMMALLSLAALSGLGPSYSLFLFGVVYTFPFMGIKKGVTNNDLYYSLLLPVRREKVALARIASTTVLQIIYSVLALIVSGLSLLIPEQEGMLLSIGINQVFVFFTVCFINFTVFDFIYLPWFYKKGKEVVWNMLVGTIVCAIVTSAISMIPPYVFPKFYEMITIGSASANYLLQIGIFLLGLGIYIGGKYALVKICTKEITNLDF